MTYITENPDKVIEYMQNSHDLVQPKNIESGDKNIAVWQKLLASPHRRNTSFVDTSPNRNMPEKQKDLFLQSIFG